MTKTKARHTNSTRPATGKPSPLTAKQRAFAEQFLLDQNASAAAVRAGYSPKTAGVQSCRLLKNVHVQSAYLHLDAGRSERVEISADLVLTSLALNLRRAMDAPVKEGGPTANKACELIGKHLGLFVERQEVRMQPTQNVLAILLAEVSQRGPNIIDDRYIDNLANATPTLPIREEEK